MNRAKLARWPILATMTATVFGIATTNAAASPLMSSPSVRANTTEVSVPKITHIRLTLSATNIKPGEKTAVTATITPRIAGRVVILKRVAHGRLVRVARGITNHKGFVVLRPAFTQQGLVRLRAFVTATTLFEAAHSSSVNETVTAILPLSFPPLERLGVGDHGPDVLALQQRLVALGYWLGTPNGNFGDATQQAVYALQKAAHLNPDGIVGPQAVAAINNDVLPHPRSTTGTVIEVSLKLDLVMFVHNGTISTVLNTSTGGGYTYVEQGVTDVATTPVGQFSIIRATNGLVVDPLGQLWRPRFFDAGFAIHGDTYVPPVPVSHGCVRVSNEAIDWIWANNLAPIGTAFWVY